MNRDPRQRKPGNETTAEGRLEAAPIVGLGASAGGLEPLERFFAHLPADAGIGFVVVYHQDPHRPSLLREILGRHASVPVLEASDGMRPEPDRVYVIAPGTLLTLEGGAFRVAPATDPTAHSPIDLFFRSLAAEAGERAIAVLFSASGHDGTVGLRAIKEHGGLTLAQDPETAKRHSMPESAIEAGLVDHVLPPHRLAAKLLECAGYAASAERAGTRAIEGQLADNLGRICALVRQHTGHDFASYKEGTLLRRIRRRMQVLHVPAVDRYLAVLAEDAVEAESLVKDLLIGVTQFFRDPEAFQTLAEQIVPRLIQERPADAPARIWVAGCASGEEAYSIAILVREGLEGLGSGRSVQVFATDLDAEMLAEARLGRYSPAIAERVSPERLARFFVREGPGYRAAKELREMCIFSQHSLIRDPPFSQLDLICCRNVLIYFSAELQQKLVPLFHYALRPGGFLFLGPSEGLDGSPELFETIDKSSRIFRRKETVVRPTLDFPLAARGTVRPVAIAPQPLGREQPPRTLQQRVGAAFERAVLEEYAAPSAVVNARGDLVLVAGRLERYFRLPSGAVTTNLVDLVPSGLRVELRLALQGAASARRRVVRDNVAVALDDGIRRVRLTVRPVPGLETDAGLFLVVVQDYAPLDAPEEIEEPAGSSEQPAVDHLENELRATRAELKTAVEDLESANEELKSANEELISTNEELQSANEELQTSQEELQSLNEALETINAELREKVEELGAANSDLQNLFESTEIATLFLDRELRIAKFTPAATRLFRLIESDVGRPIGDLAPRFEGLDLVGTARDVLRTFASLERQVRTTEGGAWFILRSIPYRTVRGVVVGVVVTFVDISELKRAEEALRASELRYRTLVDATGAVTWSCPPSGLHVTPQPEWIAFTGQTAHEMLGAGWTQAVHPDDLAAAAQGWTEAVAAGERFSNEHRIRRHDGEWRWMSVHAAPIRDAGGQPIEWIGMNLDITERKAAEEALRQALAKAESGDRMLAALLANVPEGITICDAQGKLRMVSQYGQDLLGGPHTGKRIEEVVRDWTVYRPDGTVMPTAELPLMQALAGETVRNLELVQVNADRRSLPLLCNAAPIRDADGEVIGAIVAWRDIGERKAAEAALSESEERLRRLGDNLPDSALYQYVHEPDGRVRFVYVSAGIERLNGIGAEEVLRDANALHGQIPPETLGRLREAEARSKGELSDFDMEIPMRRPDGELRWMRLHSRPRRLPDGRTLWDGVQIDVTERRAAEEALRLTQASIDVAAEMIAWFTPDGRVRYANDATCRTLGYPREELLGMTALDFSPGFDWAQYAEHWAEVRQRKSLTLEVVHRRRDGTLYPAEVTVNHVVHGGQEYIFAYGRDIAQRKAADEALRESEAKYRTLFENMAEEVHFWQVVRDEAGAVDTWRLVDVNPPTLKSWGRDSAEEIRGKTTDEIFGPGATEHYLPVVRKIMAEGVPHSFEDHFPHLDKYFRFTSVPLREHFITTGADITSIKRAEKELLRSREGLSRLAEASLSVMANTDLGEMLQAISGAALALAGARIATCGHGLVDGQYVGSGSAQAPGASAFPPRMPLGEMFRPDRGGVHMALVDGEDSLRLTDAQLRAHPRWWGLPQAHAPLRGLLGVPLRARNGKANGMILVSDKENGDFTADDEALLQQLAAVASLALQHVEARISLEESDRRKNEFLAMLGHELRNPLAPIRNSLYILDRSPPGGELALRAQAVIDRQVGHLTRLVDDLLDITRISRGKIQLQLERVDLCDLVRRAVDDYRETFAQHRLDLELSLPEDALWASADRTRIAQAIGNLLNNAAKFTPDGGMTAVSVERSRDLGQAIVRVRDTGIGIAPEMLPRIFEPFAQDDTTLDRSRGGLGLGLAMVKGLVEMHGGTASVASAGPGEGAELTLRLPLEPATHSAQPSGARRAGSGGRQRILVVEDNPDAAESLRRLLELLDHRVEVARSGPEGAEKARGLVPDVVLCDIGLPGMDGYEIARALRQDPRLRATRLVALSGYAAPEDLARAQEAGFDAHLAKPLSLEKLEEVLCEPRRTTAPP